MSGIDEIFKQSGLPSKRKLERASDPTQVFKSVKRSANGHSRHARVEEEPQQDSDDVEAGPAPPPPDDGGEDDDGGDYGPAAPPGDEEENGDDDEGRFFGGGITAQEREVLDYIDDADSKLPSAPEKMDAAWLRKTALAFEKRILRNAELRARHEDEPVRFMESEADLDGAVRALSILGEHPELYPEFARLGSAASLVGLLAHDNTDVAITVAEIVSELTGDDVAAAEAQWDALVDALLEADLLGLLVSNFARLNESQDADREGVYHALGVLENLCSRPDTADKIGRDEALLRWLLGRAQKAERPVTQNKQYAAEILAIMVQSSATNRQRLVDLDAVDALLQLVAAYRKRDPEKGGDEEEYMENLFGALTCLADEPVGKEKLVDAEGVELCLIMLKEGKKSKPAALRLLDHAAMGLSGTGVCVKIVEAGGLKPTFTLFMKTKDGKTTEHLLGIFASMLRLLPVDSAERIRLLAKFVEKDYEKIDKLLKLRRGYGGRVAAVDAQIKVDQQSMGSEEKAVMEDEWFSHRLDAGLFCLQTIDVILAWLIAEDSGARKKIEALLADRDESVAVIRTTIQEQIDGMDVDSDESSDLREMLRTLAQFLQ
ncbi:Catenin-beta-like protein [Lasiosphaeria miniovina]|uniref:Catenin-beta-like protein n=1 Tax=Lasiosphaeria miniovina TaxID=1954250 RepID=A0AA40EAU2_9PEZI|nr:Catenin-beta-like protein [Lasiosphaeria miniovina]KAK0733145.1 Catenin-beta-like protein [Lasiosphaeria miniovina]